MKRVEMTAEQMYQEAYFADRCLESADPVFIARGEKILKLHKERSIGNKSDQEGSLEVYRQNGEWTMQAGSEYSPSEH